MQDNPGMEEFYRAAVGPKNAEYYVTRFLRFDEPGASRVSWNWPAFFISFWWGLYRRMYASSFLYCLAVPVCLGFALGVVLGVLHRPPSLVILNLMLAGYSWLIVPLFANSIY